MSYAERGGQYSSAFRYGEEEVVVLREEERAFDQVHSFQFQRLSHCARGNGEVKMGSGCKDLLEAGETAK